MARPRSDPAPSAALPAGVPTWGFRHGRYVWPRGQPPVLLLFRDWDVFLVESGEGAWTFPDGRRAVAGPGDLAVLPPFVPAYVSESRRPFVFRFCHLDFRRPAETEDARAREFAGPGGDARLPLAISGRDAPRAVAAYRALAAIDPAAPGEPWRLERAVIALAAALADHAARSPAGPGASRIAGSAAVDPRVARLMQAIEWGPARAWRVADAAATVGVSVDRLNELVRAGMGRPLKRAIVDARLRRALRLLLERPAASICEIAEAAGFSSQHFFSRQFRARYGEPPLAWRRRALAAPA